MIGRGWWKEYYRHSLAARGIPTRYFARSKRAEAEGRAKLAERFGAPPGQLERLKKEAVAYPVQSRAPGGYTPAKLKAFPETDVERVLMTMLVSRVGQPGYTDRLGTDKEEALKNWRRYSGIGASSDRPSISDDLARLARERAKLKAARELAMEREDERKVAEIEEALADVSEERKALLQEMVDIRTYFEEKGVFLSGQPIPMNVLEDQRKIAEADLKEVEAFAVKTALPAGVAMRANRWTWTIKEENGRFVPYVGNERARGMYVSLGGGQVKYVDSAPESYSSKAAAEAYRKEQIEAAQAVKAEADLEGKALKGAMQTLRNEIEELQKPQYLQARLLQPLKGKGRIVGITTYVKSSDPLREDLLQNLEKSITKRMNAIKYADAVTRANIEREIKAYEAARKELLPEVFAAVGPLMEQYPEKQLKTIKGMAEDVTYGKAGVSAAPLRLEEQVMPSNVKRYVKEARGEAVPPQKVIVGGYRIRGGKGVVKGMTPEGEVTRQLIVPRTVSVPEYGEGKKPVGVLPPTAAPTRETPRGPRRAVPLFARKR